MKLIFHFTGLTFIVLFAILLDNILMYYVYILEKNIDKTWYIGYTSDLRERINNHNNGKGGKTTKEGKSWKLMYYEAYLNKADATGREIFLKSGSGHKFINKQLFNYLKNR